MRRFLRTALPALALIAVIGAPITVTANPPDDTDNRPHSQNMHLIGSSIREGAVTGPPPAGPGDVSWDTRNTDLAFWGKRVIQGRYDGFRVIDISAPGNPREIAYHKCISPQGDIGVWGNLVFRSVDSPTGTDGCTTDRANSLSNTVEGCAPVAPPCIGFEGIQIFDISDLDNIQLVKSVPLDCGSHTHTVVPDKNNPDRVLIYNSVSGAGTQSGNSKYGNRCSGTHRREDIVAVPAAAPQNASVIGNFSLGMTTTGGFMSTCHDFGVILGDVELGACAGSPQVAVFDLSNPAAPVWLRSMVSPTVTNYHSAIFSADGSILALGWEPGGGTEPRCQVTGAPLNQSGTQLQTDEMKSIFFHDTATGALLGKHILPRPQSQWENCTIHNYNVVPHPTKNLLVHGSYQSGTAVVDFTDPTNAYEVAWMDPDPLDPPTATTPGGRSAYRGGEWSSFWYNGFIYESNTRLGLFVWKASAPELAGTSTKLDFLNPQTQHAAVD